MKIDPNQPIEFNAECILCEKGDVVLSSDARIPLVQLDKNNDLFKEFCESLDPNKCYILAIIPDENDKDVFFKAREVASEQGIYMQALVDTPENHRARWDSYIKMKSL